MRRRNLVALRGQTGMPPAFICDQKKKREREENAAENSNQFSADRNG